SGRLQSSTAAPVPAGETVQITLEGVTQDATIGSDGGFSATFDTSALDESGSPYSLTFRYVGDANFREASGSSTLTVQNQTLTVSGTSFTATEGATFRATVATFSDPGTCLPGSSFTAAIDWGDGTTSAGTVLPDRGKGRFLVRGSHGYAEEGSYSV